MSLLAHHRLAAAIIAILTAFVCQIATGALNRGTLRATAQARYGAQGVETILEWVYLVDQARSEPVAEQLYRVNEFFNGRTIFQSDDEVWHQSDYWATPLELLTRGRGDCEDYAIAKYVSLLALGVPQSHLRLIYVKAMYEGTSQAHMVLGYYSDSSGEPQILDNLTNAIERASSRTDLTPVFSFNGEGLWAGGVRAASDPTERLSRWRDLLSRLRTEGFQ